MRVIDADSGVDWLNELDDVSLPTVSLRESEPLFPLRVTVRDVTVPVPLVIDDDAVLLFVNDPFSPLRLFEMLCDPINDQDFSDRDSDSESVSVRVREDETVRERIP